MGSLESIVKEFLWVDFFPFLFPFPPVQRWFFPIPSLQSPSRPFDLWKPEDMPRAA